MSARSGGDERAGRAARTPVVVRREEPKDHPSVFRLHEAAFETDAEASLVEALRLEARPLISLVGVAGDEVIGHILFTPVSIGGEAGRGTPGTIMGLGPMAVLPEQQNRGVGSELVWGGLDACRAAGVAAVFVLGHRSYYPRFGFEPAAPRFRFKHPDFDPHFMFLELRSAALEGLAGMVEYHPAFDRV